MRIQAILAWSKTAVEPVPVEQMFEFVVLELNSS
jgi:hypothetical protein